jgi:hypothetical protein
VADAESRPRIREAAGNEDPAINQPVRQISPVGRSEQWVRVHHEAQRSAELTRSSPWRPAARSTVPAFSSRSDHA